MDDFAVCGGCGRGVLKYSFEWRYDWLDAPNKYEEGKQVVRCPQHLVVWALKVTYGASLPVRQWAKQARERDEEFRTKASNPLIEPFPFKLSD